MTMPAPVPKLSNATAPEPAIGPGMILERGRDRFIVASTEPVTGIEAMAKPAPLLYAVIWQRRSFFGTWGIPQTDTRLYYRRSWIAALLLSGFRVIRPADQHKEPSP